MMSDIRCKIISEPHDHKAVFRQTSVKSPYFNGDDYEDLPSSKFSYLCGSCGFILAKNIHSDQISQLLKTDQKGLSIVLQCPQCERFNELNIDLSKN
jgi:phage FluMu protein Com